MTRNTLVAVLALTTAGLLSGCAGAQPGVAAQVGDETIQVSDVNRLSDGYCAAYERQLEGDGTVLPMEVVTSNVVQTLTMTAVARQLAEEHGVEPSTTYQQNLANLEQAGDALADDAGEAKVTIESGLAYVNDILEQVGRKTLAEDGVTDPTVEDADGARQGAAVDLDRRQRARDRPAVRAQARGAPARVRRHRGLLPRQRQRQGGRPGAGGRGPGGVRADPARFAALRLTPWPIP